MLTHLCLLQLTIPIMTNFFNLFLSLTVLALANAHGPGGMRGLDIDHEGGLGDRDGEGPGGKGHGPPGCEMLDLFGEPTFNSSDCQNTAAEPICSYNRDGDLGVWVCRKVYSPWTGVAKEFSDCIDPEMGLSGDDCGCCDESCPTLCTCACYASDGTAGFRVMPAEDDAVGLELCVPPKHALDMIAHNNSTCVTSCNDEP
jgi:hypothetical protein